MHGQKIIIKNSVLSLARKNTSKVEVHDSDVPTSCWDLRRIKQFRLPMSTVCESVCSFPLRHLHVSSSRGSLHFTSSIRNFMCSLPLPILSAGFLSLCLDLKTFSSRNPILKLSLLKSTGFFVVRFRQTCFSRLILFVVTDFLFDLKFHL